MRLSGSRRGPFHGSELCSGGGQLPLPLVSIPALHAGESEDVLLYRHVAFLRILFSAHLQDFEASTYVVPAAVHGGIHQEGSAGIHHCFDKVWGNTRKTGYSSIIIRTTHSSQLWDRR